MADAPPAYESGISPYLLYLTASATLGALQFGYHLAELNAPQGALICSRDLPSSPLAPSKPAPPDLDSSLPTCIPMTPAAFAVVSSIFTLGGLLGAVAAGPLSSRKGRLFPLRLTAPFFILGSLFEALAPSIGLLLVGRVLSGIGAGASIVVGPIYIAEIAPPRRKGILGAATQVLINAGIVITQVLGWLLGYGMMWRLVLGVGAILGAVQLAMLAFAIESPEWLGANGQTRQARRNLARIRGGKLGAEESAKWLMEGEDEAQGLLANGAIPSPKPDAAAHPTRVGMLEAARSPLHRPAVIAVVAVMMAQQLCGINSVIMYSTSFLAALLPTAAALVTVAVGVLNLVCTALFAPLPDRIGRRPCLLLSIGGMGAFALVLGFAIPAGAKVVSAVATLLFAASFALGLGPVPFILASELATPDAVGGVQSWALTANWIATFAVAQLFPVVNGLVGGRAFFGFTGLALVFGCFVAWWLPESMGKRDADEVWGRLPEDRRED